ncbi:peptidase S8 [Candidatus Parcubacteria bacterium]|nr:MAG: peptidase S8 [Candidatus Parcubacteria bacterium]
MSEEELSVVENDPRVAFVSEDRLVSTTASARENAFFSWRRGTPPPPPPQVLPTGVDRINAENKANTGTGMHVAVIDTGIDLTHPDLQANIVGGKNCTSSKPADYGDQNGHGTHVAGTIAALNNTQGVVGVAPAAKLWSVRVLDRNGYGSWSSVICGLDFVASKGPANGGSITVANMSLGGSGVSDNNCGNSNNDALHKAVCRVRDAGVILVVAAGNEGKNTSGFVPAAYDDAVITVSALVDTDGTSGGGGSGTSYGADDTFASFSNYGSAVDIGAPGVNINSTWLSGGYKSISGTSMASPHVAGVAVLYLSTHPGSSWTDVRGALLSSGEALGSGHSDPSGKHSEPVLRADTL